MMDKSERDSHDSGQILQGLVVVHAAVNGGMMSNFGRLFAQRLVEEGAELHFFASGNPVFGWPPPVKDLEDMGGKFHGLPISENFAPVRMAWTLLIMVRNLRRLGVDIIHTRGSVMGIVGRVAARLAGVPLVIHHQDDLYCREGRLSPLVRRIAAFIETRLSHLTDRTLFVSQVVLEDALAIGFSPERCVLVGHDLNQMFQNAAQQSAATKEPVLSRLRDLGVPKDTRLVGCVGRLAHLKGIDLFLAAAERLASSFPGWAFVIKGNGPMRESLQAAIDEKGLAARVFLFTEELPNQDLPAYYRCLDIFALPTRREGFGMAFVEAMAMGVPVVGPRIAPITELVSDGCGVLVEPENVEAWVQALSGLMSDLAFRSRIAEKGRQHALTTWCGRRAAESVLDVYRELLSHTQMADSKNTTVKQKDG